MLSPVASLSELVVAAGPAVREASAQAQEARNVVHVCPFLAEALHSVHPSPSEPDSLLSGPVTRSQSKISAQKQVDA